MKVLLWSIYSPWTMNFLENFLTKNKHEVWMIRRSNKKEYKRYNDFYKRMGVHIIELPKKAHKIQKNKTEENILKNLYSRILIMREIIKNGPYDLINMHYVEYINLIDLITLKIFTKSKLILSFWGSDLLRVDSSDLNILKKILRFVDFVTFDNKDLEEIFKMKFGNKVLSKTVLFGLPILDIINETQKNIKTDDLREKWGISNNKTVIAIGYNGIPAQQHIAVLKVIERLDTVLKEKIILLIQMSYGGTKIYKKQVIETVKKTGCDYIVIQDFLGNNEIAELRIITDVFINAQFTDAFSGSVCENLYSGTLLLNAKWLHYKEFEEYDFEYLEFEHIKDINKLVEIALKNNFDTSKNKALVWKLRSWKNCIQKWETIYQKVVKL